MRYRDSRCPGASSSLRHFIALTDTPNHPFNRGSFLRCPRDANIPLLTSRLLSLPFSPPTHSPPLAPRPPPLGSPPHHPLRWPLTLVTGNITIPSLLAGKTLTTFAAFWTSISHDSTACPQNPRLDHHGHLVQTRRASFVVTRPEGLGLTRSGVGGCLIALGRV